ncbi:hypothetical protein LguiB_001647 [Lonicera macranthoides]
MRTVFLPMLGCPTNGIDTDRRLTFHANEIHRRRRSAEALRNEQILPIGLLPSLDDEEFEMDEYQKSELEKAICQSKISIVVISKDYASSTECLDELINIVEACKLTKATVFKLHLSAIKKQNFKKFE